MPLSPEPAVLARVRAALARVLERHADCFLTAAPQGFIATCDDAQAHGSTRAEALAALRDVLMASEGNSVTPAEQDAVTVAISNGSYRWCRARLLHALVGAARQGVLDEVFGELFEADDGAVVAALKRKLAENGWLP